MLTAYPRADRIGRIVVSVDKEFRSPRGLVGGKPGFTPIPKNWIYCYFCKTSAHLEVDPSLNRMKCDDLTGGCGRTYSTLKRGFRRGHGRKKG